MEPVLDFVDIRDRVVELDLRLLATSPSVGGRSARPCCRLRVNDRNTGVRGSRLLLLRSGGRRLVVPASRTLDILPLLRCRVRSRDGREPRRKLARDMADGSVGRDDGDEAALVALGALTFDAVAGGEEGVEPLDEEWMASEEGGHAVDDAGGVNADEREESGQDMDRNTGDVPRRRPSETGRVRGDAHLALELLHDVEEPVVDVRLVMELDLWERGGGRKRRRRQTAELKRQAKRAIPGRGDWGKEGLPRREPPLGAGWQRGEVGRFASPHAPSFPCERESKTASSRAGVCRGSSSHRHARRGVPGVRPLQPNPRAHRAGRPAAPPPPPSRSEPATTRPASDSP